MKLPRRLLRRIALLEREGEFKEISAEVNTDLEITEIIDPVVKSRGPALPFERPKRSQHPLLITSSASSVDLDETPHLLAPSGDSFLLSVAAARRGV